MIKLLRPLNHKGTLIDAGTNIGFLPPEFAAKLIENGAAREITISEIKEEIDLDTMTKDELIEYALKHQIEGVTKKMKLPEIIAVIKGFLSKSKE